MSSSRGPRTTTVARLMILNAVAAVPLAAYQLGLTGMAELSLVLAPVWVFLLLALCVSILLESFVGLRCPSCRRFALRRLALAFSWMSYYECTACRVRCKRRPVFGLWQDASGAEDDPKYRRKAAAKWLHYSVPECDDSTCGTLLRHKRDRAASRRRDEDWVESSAKPVSPPEL